jgi:hypothetical protein
MYNLVERPFKKPLPVKPIMIIAKSMYAIFPGQFCLSDSRLLKPQIIKTEIGGYMGLIMPREKRLSFCHIPPFSKALSPPRIILRNRVVLREVET